MIGRLNHVGIATPSIEQSWKLYLDVLGATKVTEKKALPEQGVWVSFVDLPNAQIELIEPYGDNSPITALPGEEPARRATPRLLEVPDICRPRRDAGQGRNGAGDRRAAQSAPTACR